MFTKMQFNLYWKKNTKTKIQGIVHFTVKIDWIIDLNLVLENRKKDNWLLTLAAGLTETQFPDSKLNLASPIRCKISSGVSLGPWANGVCLWNRNKENYALMYKTQKH